MVDVRFKYPRLFKVFEDLFGVNAESMLIDVYVECRSLDDADHLASAFNWYDTHQGNVYWRNQYIIHKHRAYPHG